MEHPANRGPHLLGNAADLAEKAPNLKRAAPDAKQGVAANTLYDQIKRFFGGCAQQVLKNREDARGVERFTQASTHWLRHTHASHAIAGGLGVQIVQENLGHASLATTTVYVTTETKRRMRALQGFWKA